MDSKGDKRPSSVGTSDPTGGVRLRMSKALAEGKRREGSYSKLEIKIREAISIDGKLPGKDSGIRPVDRRKLRNIVENDPKLTLSIGELRAIDQYLKDFGDSLSHNPLFVQPEVLRSIAESRRVAFLLGSKRDVSDPYRVYLSQFDFHAMSDMQRALQRFREHVHIDVVEFLAHEDVKRARDAYANAEGLDLFLPYGPSLISLGSPISNNRTSWMLAFMAGLNAPFVDARSIREPEMPFQFVWPEKGGHILESPFHVYAHDIESEDPEVAKTVREGRAAGFRYRGGYLIDELSNRNEQQGKTYAVCAAQRRPGGQVWLCCAGVTGAATYMASRWIHRMSAQMDEHPKDQCSPMFWALLSADAVRVKRGNREMIETRNAQVVDSDSCWGDVAPVPNLKPAMLGTHESGGVG